MHPDPVRRNDWRPLLMGRHVLQRPVHGIHRGPAAKRTPGDVDERVSPGEAAMDADDLTAGDGTPADLPATLADAEPPQP